MAINIQGIIGAFIAIVIGTALLGPLQTQVSNATGTVGIAGTSTATIVGLISLLFGVGLLVLTIRSMISGGK